MPSFYPPHRPTQPGFPGSEYDHHPFPSHYAGFSEPIHSSQGHFGHEATDIHHMQSNGYDAYKAAQQLYAGVGYGQRHNHHASATARQHLAGPMIAPVRMGDHSLHHSHSKRTQAVERPSYHQQSNEDDRPVGGVSAKLDYNMEEMTDFVVDMAIAIVAPNSYNIDTYRKWVVQVLNATRLPSATILLSLSYLSLRVRNLTNARLFNPSEYSLYEFLTVALILGSKFLDDNTFQNKSWAEVSNIKVSVLNKEELSWLASFDHRLHHDPHRLDGFACWERRWNAFQAKSASAAIAATMQASDQEYHYQRSLRSPVGGPHYHPQYPVSAMSNIALEPEIANPAYPASNYSPYESWFGQRSAIDRSPSTAPHTGPNTPEFYAGHGGWTPFDPYPQRNRSYAYVGPPPIAANFEAFPPAYEPAGMGFNGNSVWNTHGAACQCSSCRQTQVSRYGPIVVG